MRFRLQTTEAQLQAMLNNRKAEIDIWKDFDDKQIAQQKGAALGTSIPALYSVFYKFIQNPSTVSVDTYKRMIDTDDTIGAGVDFLTIALASRLGRYEHKSAEITEWVNARLDEIEGGFYNFVKEMLSGQWAGFYCGEKVWKNTENGYCIDRIVSMPQTSLLFEVDAEGRVEDDGILQYQRNVNPFGGSASTFWGGQFASGFVFNGVGAGRETDPLAKYGDMAYPIRNANSFLYMTVRIPKQKVIHYACDSQGKMGNPYGRSILRRCFNSYIAKAQTVQMMLRALDRKGTPLMVVYSAPNATVKDPNRTRANPGNVKGKNVGEDAGRSVSKAFANIHNDTVVTLPGKKGQIYEVDVVPVDAHADQFIAAIQHFDRASLRALLIPSLIFSNGDGTGSNALGDTHAKTWDKICDGSLQGVKQTLREQLVKDLLMYNFPKSAWDRDGIGDFSKRELTQDEKDKEIDSVEKAVNLGVCDLTDIKDYNSAREKFGFEPKDSVPEIITNPPEEEGVEGNDGGGDGGGDEEPNKAKSKMAARRDFSYKGFIIRVEDAAGRPRITISGQSLYENFIATTYAEGIEKAKKIIDGWIEDGIAEELSRDPAGARLSRLGGEIVHEFKYKGCEIWISVNSEDADNADAPYDIVVNYPGGRQSHHTWFNPPKGRIPDEKVVDWLRGKGVRFSKRK